MFYKAINFIRKLNREIVHFSNQNFQIWWLISCMEYEKILNFSSVSLTLCQKTTGTWGINTTKLYHLTAHQFKPINTPQEIDGVNYKGQVVTCLRGTFQYLRENSYNLKTNTYFTNIFRMRFLIRNS